MRSLHVLGGKPLFGALRVQGAKNSALPILAAAVLAEGVSVIRNCPRLSDTDAAVRILREIGCRVWLDGEALYVDSSGPVRPEIPESLMREMRSSVVFLGPLLARCGEVRLSAPGGCEIGARPIDLHLLALRSMGAEIEERGGTLNCRANCLRGCRVDLPFPSVGATENAVLAACLGRGETLLTNAAREPEIADLQRFLNAAGASVSGAGSSVIRVQGVKKLHGAAHRVIPDRIAASTWLAACAAAGGDVKLYDTEWRHYRPVLRTLKEMGCDLQTGENLVRIRSTGKLKAAGPVVTRPYPGFPTDAQPLIMAAALRAEGATAFRETIFESRLRHVPELLRMGADIRTEGRCALVWGVPKLRGAEVRASDLRGGAALVIAALAAEGETRICGPEYLDRGYESVETSLAELGAEIERKEDRDG